MGQGEFINFSFEPKERVVEMAFGSDFICHWSEMPEYQPLPWLIEGLLPASSLAVLAGGSGVGKSFIALDIACSIASGIDWHGRSVMQGDVVYVAGEGF